MGNSNSRLQKNIKPQVTASTIEKISVNNSELGKIRDTLSKYTDSDKNNEEVMLDTWKAATVIADYQKIRNSSAELSRRAKYAKDERKTLEEAVSNNVVLANILASQRQTPLLHTKERISEINNDSFREKEILVNRLMYVIYFILFAVGLGIALAAGVISMKMLGYTFAIGLLYLVYALLSAGSFWKAYGDLSMGIAKGAVKEVITAVGPIKKCPERCNIKPSYAKYKLKFLDSADNYEPICGKGGSKFNNNTLSSYDYTYDDIETDSKNFEDCNIGEFQKCKDKREKSFVCKWNNGTRPDNEPEYLNSSVPCNNYLNRVNVLNVLQGTKV